MKNECFCVCTVDMKHIYNAIRNLPETESGIINLLYGLTDDGKRTPYELAEKYGCKITDIFTVRDSVLKLLRREMRANYNHKHVIKCENCLNSKWLRRGRRGESLLMEAILAS